MKTAEYWIALREGELDGDVLAARSEQDYIQAVQDDARTETMKDAAAIVNKWIDSGRRVGIMPILRQCKVNIA